MLNIYINTWGNYNENGADGGRWITLPMDNDDLENIMDEVAEAMGDNDPEWFVNDYEWTTAVELGNVRENDGYFYWNEICNQANELEEYELWEILAAVEAFEYDFLDAMTKHYQGYFTFYPNMTLEEVAEELIDECYNLPEFALQYFDYEAFARDLGYDGYYETEYGTIVE